MSAHDQMHYERYTTSDGLPASRVTSMCEDAEGNVWMNTWNGICKWDGKSLSGFRSTADGQRFGRTTGILVLRDGKLFFTNDAKQRICLDPETLTLCPVPDYPDFLPQHVSSIVCTEDENGLSFERRGIVYHIPYDEGKREERQLHHVFEDRSGQLWLDFNNSLYRIWFEPSPFYYHLNWPYGEHRPFQSTVRALLTDRNGNLLAASRNFQLYGLADTIMSGPYPGNAYKIVDDNRGRLWLAMRKKGLYVWTRESGIWPAMENLTGQGLDDLFSLYLVDEKYLWAGTWGNGVRVVSIEGDSAVLKQTLINDSLRHIHEFVPRSDGSIGICTMRGLHFYSEAGKPLSVALPLLDVMDAEEISDGRMLICTMGHGQYWLMPDGECKPAEDMQIEDRLATIYQTPDSMLWLISDTRMYRYNFHTGKIDEFDEKDFGAEVSFSESTVTLYQDSLLMVGASSGIVEVNLNLIDEYVEQRDSAIAQDLKSRLLLWSAIVVAIMCFCGLFGWLFWRLMRIKKTSRPVPQVKLGGDMSDLNSDDRKFLEELTRVLSGMICKRDADISGVAGTMGISKNELYIRCNEILHATPAAVLQDMRIEYSRQLLKQGKMSIKEVAYLIGFNDPKYFSKVFKAKVGISPSQVSDEKE